MAWKFFIRMKSTVSDDFQQILHLCSVVCKWSFKLCKLLCIRESRRLNVWTSLWSLPRKLSTIYLVAKPELITYMRCWNRKIRYSTYLDSFKSIDGRRRQEKTKEAQYSGRHVVGSWISPLPSYVFRVAVTDVDGYCTNGQSKVKRLDKTKVHAADGTFVFMHVEIFDSPFRSSTLFDDTHTMIQIEGDPET